MCCFACDADIDSEATETNNGSISPIVYDDAVVCRILDSNFDIFGGADADRVMRFDLGRRYYLQIGKSSRGSNSICEMLPTDNIELKYDPTFIEFAHTENLDGKHYRTYEILPKYQCNGGTVIIVSLTTADKGTYVRAITATVRRPGGYFYETDI